MPSQCQCPARPPIDEGKSDSSEAYVAWADTAKIMCIVLVVLYHARHLSHLIPWTDKEFVNFVWEHISSIIKPVRMPLFFLISGMLASQSLNRSWNEIRNRRIFNLYYIFIIWAIIFAVLIPAFPSHDTSWSHRLVRIREIPSGLSAAWYLWALPTFFLLARVTRTMPTVIPLLLGTLAAIVAVLAKDHLHVQHTSMLRCLLFFMIGIRIPSLPIRFANLVTSNLLILLMIAFGVTFLISSRFDSDFNPVVDTFAVLAGISIAKICNDRFIIVRTISKIYKVITLPIYILHFPIILIICTVSKNLIP